MGGWGGEEDGLLIVYFSDDCLLSGGILWLQEPEVPDGRGRQRAAVQGPHRGRRLACEQAEASRQDAAVRFGGECVRTVGVGAAWLCSRA